VGDTWYGEFPSGYAKQHLQFLVLANKCATCQFKLAGSGLQNFYGVLYNAGNSGSGGGCGNACAIQISGGSGASTGPPFLTGQIVSDNVAFSGNTTIVVYYRPCNQGPTPCGSGPGTSLVE
jgi:hypothetical protein